jgi:hypothetical protein
MDSTRLLGSHRGPGVAVQLAVGLVLAGTLLGCASVSGSGASQGQSPATTGSRAADAARAVIASGSLTVGKAYPFRLFIHCGVPVVGFGGRAWQPVPPVPAYPGPRPVNGTATYTGYVPGTMTLIDARTLRFTADDTAVVSPFSVVFRPSTVRVAGSACS